jgi:hypothetical protein
VLVLRSGNPFGSSAFTPRVIMEFAGDLPDPCQMPLASLEAGPRLPGYFAWGCFRYFKCSACGVEAGQMSVVASAALGLDTR